MTEIQALWWKQASSDMKVYAHLRRHDFAPCHALHYLQMASEKLAKAYWSGRRGNTAFSHAAFVSFLQSLYHLSRTTKEKVAGQLGFRFTNHLESWIDSNLPLAYELEKMAPALAGENGPNPEYPWPKSDPAHCPVEYVFPLWDRLIHKPSGRQFLVVLDRAVQNFPHFA